MTDKAENQVQQPEAAADVKPGDVAELNIQDLNAMKVVGQTYEKLTAFLDAVAKQAEASKTGA